MGSFVRFRLARGKLRKRGFTLSELLISVAIISIAMLAALASLSFGIKASDQSGHTTEALNLERRILELILSGCHPPYSSAIASPGIVYTVANGFGPYQNGVPLAPPTTGNPNSWIPLSTFVNAGVSPFAPTDFLNPADPNDAMRMSEQASRYFVNIGAQQHQPWSGETAPSAAGDPTLCTEGLLFDVEVDVGWWEKGVWKTLYTQGIYHFKVTF
jgi:prepilin-type N-terminal cleavage/methylation domain-containing protein